MRSLSLVSFLILLWTSSCGHLSKNSGDLTQKGSRGPSSIDVNSSCGDLILPIIDEYRTLKPERWELSELVRRDLVDEEQYYAFRENEDWQRFIARENQSDEEKEMGFTVLSMLKKRFPKVDDGRLKDRYRVLMAFCGD